MSHIKTYSRGDLHDTYKGTYPKIANKFLGKEYPSDFVPVCSTVAIGLFVLATLLTIAFVQLSHTSFATVGLSDPRVWTALVTVGAIVVGPALIALAVWHCKRQSVRAERIEGREVNKIAGTQLVDARPGLDQL